MQKILEVPKDWEKEWKGMPEYHIQDLTSFSSLIVHFKSKADRDAFAELLQQRITNKTKTLWYPKLENFIASEFAYVDSEEKIAAPAKTKRKVGKR